MVLKDYEIELSRGEKSWFATDGKELKGSIEKGSKRGVAVVQVVRHKDREVVGQSFYNGKKESEVPAVKKLLERTGIKREKVTLDALHLKPNSLELIDQSGGAFLVGLSSSLALANVGGKYPSGGFLSTEPHATMISPKAAPKIANVFITPNSSINNGPPIPPKIDPAPIPMTTIPLMSPRFSGYHFKAVASGVT